MKTVTTFLCLLLFAEIKAQDIGWSWQNPYPTGRKLTSIKVLDSNAIIAVGYGGTILKSTNGGYNWFNTYNNSTINFEDVFFTDQNTGYIIGNDLIIKTTNQGDSWFNYYDFPTNTNLRSIFFISPDIGWTIGSGQNIYKTTNGGIDWFNIQISYYGNSIYFINQDTGFISCTNSKGILKTTDGGLNWVFIAFSQYMNTFHFINQSIGWTAGQWGYIYKTTNSGLNWFNVYHVSDDLFDIKFLDASTGFAIGDNGKIFRSNDGGSSWSLKTSSATTNLKNIDFDDYGKGLIVGDIGTIIKSTNYGMNWDKINNSTRQNLNSIFFITKNYGWAVGDTGVILNTNNSGKYWNNLPIWTTYNLYSVFFIDTNIGFISSQQGKIFKTTNKGITWTEINSGTTNPIKKILFLNNIIGYACAGDIVLKTTDSGQNWFSASSGISTSLNSINFVDTNLGYAVGNWDDIYKTTNGGENWNTLFSPTYNEHFYSVYFVDQNNGYIVGTYGTIIGTSNGGNNWFFKDQSTMNSFFAVNFPNLNTGWVVGQSGMIYKALDGGNVWNEYLSPTTSNLKSLHFHDKNNGWAVGENGNIIKFTSLQTQPIFQPTNIIFSNITQNSIKITFNRASDYPDGYIIYRNTLNYSSDDPQDGIVYTQGQILSDGIIAHVGNDTVFIDSNLTKSTTFYYKIYSYNGNDENINYLTSLPLKNFASTISSPPYILSHIQDTTLDEDFNKVFIVDLNFVFNDSDDTDLFFTANADNNNLSPLISNDSLYLISSLNNTNNSKIYITANDPFSSVTDSFLVFITPVNDPPIVNIHLPDTTTFEDFGKIFTRRLSDVFSDADNDILTFTGNNISGPANILISHDSLYLISIKDSNGFAGFVITAYDSFLSTSDTFRVTILSVNDPPIILNAPRDTSFLEEFGTVSTYYLNTIFDDIDNDTLNYTASNAVSGITTQLSNDTLYLISSDNYFGNISIRLNAFDGEYNIVDSFIVTIFNTYDPPSLKAQLRDTSFSEDFGEEMVYTFSEMFNNPDSVTLINSAVNLSTGLTAHISHDSLYLKSQDNFFGYVDVYTSVFDGTVTVGDTFGITIIPVNDPPHVAISIPDHNLNEDFSSIFICELDSIFTDIDDSILTFSASNLTNGVIPFLIGDSLYLNSINNFFGNVKVMVTASDGEYIIADTFNVTIMNIYDSIYVEKSIGDTIAYEDFGSLFVAKLSNVFANPDQTSLEYSSNPQLQWITTIISNDSLYLISVLNFNGITGIIVTANDGFITVKDTFNVAILPVNDSPFITSPISDQTKHQDFNSYTVAWLDTVFNDIDTGDQLAYSVETNGLVNAEIISQNLVLNSVYNTYGTGIVIVRATDNETAVVRDTFLVLIEPANLTISSYILNFESVNINTSKDRWVYFNNSSQTTINYTIEKSGNDANQFSVDKMNGIVNGLSNDSISVSFHPSLLNERTAKLVVSGNFSTGPDTIQLSGFGRSTAVAITPKTDSLYFGNVVNTTISDSQLIILKNNGNINLHYSLTVRASGNHVFDSTMFIPSISGQRTLLVGLADTLHLRFRPTIEGVREAKALLTFIDDFAADSSKIYYLTGTGIKDIYPPVISSNVTVSPRPAQTGTQVDITTNITDNLLVTTSFLLYRKGNSAAWANPVSPIITGNTYKFTIPGIDITAIGIIYQIIASDADGNKDTVTGTFDITIPAGQFTMSSIQGNPYVSGFPEGKWHMISVPIILNNASVTEVLKDLGAPGNRRWLLFDSDQDVSTSASFVPGKAYWLKQILNQGSKLISLGSGHTANLSDGQIILRPGWNQIGNPYTFAVDWITDTDAGQNPNIKGPVKWNGSKYVGLGQNSGDPTPFTEILPWDGYWLLNTVSTNQTLRIFPPGKLFSLFKTSDYNYLPHLSQEGWKINLIASTNISEDSYNYVGAMPDAEDGEDRYDLPELPVIGDYSSLYFDHKDESGKAHPYTIDYRPNNQTGYIWDMYVKSNVKDKHLLRWETGNLPAGFEILIYNISDNRIVDRTDYTFTVKSESHPVRFRVITGNSEYVQSELLKIQSELPTQFSLLQNYPNPFNPLTNIKYELPRQSKVTLKIYNTLGQEVKTLLSEKISEPGRYSATWDGTNYSGSAVSSGVYIYRLEAEGFIQTKKMMLIK